MDEQHYEPMWLKPDYLDGYTDQRGPKLRLGRSERLDGVTSMPLERPRNELERLQQALTAEHMLRVTTEKEVLNLQVELVRYRQDVELLRQLILAYFVDDLSGVAGDNPVIAFAQDIDQRLWFLDQTGDDA